MQPHRYTRLRDLMDEFATCFNEADSVFIADVYAAGETAIEGSDKETLVQAIQNVGHKDVSVLNDEKDLPALISGKAQSGDIVLFLGAGDITNWAYSLPAQLEALNLEECKTSYAV